MSTLRVKINSISLVALFLVAGKPAVAQTPSVDWKLYGSASVGGDQEICFYESLGAATTPQGYVRVWAKCLPQKDIDAIDLDGELGRQIVERTAKKVIRNYVPPIATIESADAEQVMTVIRYEEAADLANIQPRARIFYELNCSKSMIRELSIFIQVGGKIGSEDKPREWQYIPPEGSAATLSKLLCRRDG